MNIIFADFIVILSNDTKAFENADTRISIGKPTIATIAKNITILFMEVYSKPNILIIPPPTIAITEITAIKIIDTNP